MYSLQEILALIEAYESGGGKYPGRNVPNFNYGKLTADGKQQTAQGYYQITNTNWRNLASQAGIDLSQYPNAMSAPKELQARVAALLLQTEKGIHNWIDYNPALRRAYERGEKVSGSGNGVNDANKNIPNASYLSPLPEIKSNVELRRLFLLGVGAVLITLALFSMRG